MKWFVVSFWLICVAVSLISADAEVFEDEEHEILVRNTRGVQNRENCRYGKTAWSECDFKTNTKSRTLTLKKGDPSVCEATKTIQKKCKRGCRYDKASWSPCKENGEMTRTDTLKANSDAGCEQVRLTTKKCNRNKVNKNNKEKGNKGNRRNRQ